VQDKFLADLLAHIPLKKLLQEAEETENTLSKDKHFVDALALTIGCYLGNQQGIDIYQAACDVLAMDS